MTLAFAHTVLSLIWSWTLIVLTVLGAISGIATAISKLKFSPRFAFIQKAFVAIGLDTKVAREVIWAGIKGTENPKDEEKK